MLKPLERRVLLEALRPPQGYTVDRALATTYSLDLVALLIAPLSFSLFDRVVGVGDAASADASPVGATALLQAVRAHAERLSVFCQAGHIAQPSQYRQLLAYLEGSVIEVRPKSDLGVFHPKVWVLRFAAPEQPVRYRVVVNSRNLTFDRAWDTMLVLDGELTARTNAFARNRPLSDFVAALPSLAVRPVPERAAQGAAILADELRRVDFELPAEFDEMRFWPIGHDGKKGWPFTGKIDRILVVSPFIAAETLGRLSAAGGNHVLVSRAEELVRLSAASLAGFEEVHVLNEGAEVETQDAEVDLPRADEAARGLHAKLYVADAGWRARVWTGSANATVAAFQHNVEFLVELEGKRSNVGVDALLGTEGGEMSLRTLLVPFTPAADAVPEDPAVKALDDRVRALRAAIANAPWIARVQREPDAADEQERYRIDLRADVALDFGPGAEVRCWPIAIAPEHGVGLTTGRAATSAVFPRCSFEALTSFFAFNVRVQQGGRTAEAVFVVNAPLEGAPEQRHARILLAMLDDPAKVMRFLRMLLALDPMDALDELLGIEGGAETQGGGWSGSDSGAAILEALLRTLDRDPDRLAEFDRTVLELRATAEGAALLPPELDDVWEPIRVAWQSRAAKGGRA